MSHHSRRKILKVEGAQKVTARTKIESRPLFIETTPILRSRRCTDKVFLDIAMKVSIRNDFVATVS